jgi:hypothetical protein
MGNCCISSQVVVLTVLALLAEVPALGADECASWQAIADPRRTDEVDSSRLPSDSEVVEAIRCLLELEGDKSPGRFGGATRADTSAWVEEEATVELDALYAISWISWQRYDHAGIVALTRDGESLDSPDTVAEAFQDVRSWFERLKLEGIEALRSRGDAPLTSGRVRWYLSNVPPASGESSGSERPRRQQ